MGGRPGSHMVSTDNVEDASLRAGAQEGPGSLLGPLWHHSDRGLGAPH